MNPAIDYFENIKEKTVLRATDLYGGSRYDYFQHEESLHTFSKAFGLPKPLLCCFCTDKVTAVFETKRFHNDGKYKSRFLLKIVAAWENWRLFTEPVEILLNGRTLFDGQLFLENVSKGWPALYWDIPLDYLDRKNTIESVNENCADNTLLIERVEILRFNDTKDFTVISCPDFVNLGQPFIIELAFLTEHKDVKCEFPADVLELVGSDRSAFTFMAKATATDINIGFYSENEQCTAVIGDVYPANIGREVFVGMDCDDYRQDESQELDRILRHFAHTQMGNFIAFRPKVNRNFPEQFPAHTESWKRWIEFCKDNDIYFQFSQLPTTLSKQEIVRIGENHFAGFQIHEPYCVSFSPVLENPPAIAKARDFVEKRDKYIEFVNETIDETSCGNAKIFCGDPSLLCVYLRESKVDNILCEPVSNSALLYGAARGSGKDFGAHLAPDWYGGFPHDQAAIDRFRLLLNLVYSYGGKHIYVESTAFKTNAFSRNDWEDTFCKSIRNTLRQFYRLTCSDSREGKPDVPLAFVYGNLESMFWRPDDRIPELSDSGKWDDVVWGKWPETQYRWLWKASDAWLPTLEFEDSGKNESLTKMFSGTPYGQVDLVSAHGDLSQYKAIALLGWNTMDEKAYSNLLKYVSNGGILFICGCHFDTRISFDEPVKMFRDGKVSDLVGAEIAGKGETVFEQFHTCILTNIIAKETESCLYEHTVGKGKVFFYNFYDYPYDMRLVKNIQRILESIGEGVSQNSNIAIEGKNRKYINYMIWQTAESSKVYINNIDWSSGNSRQIAVRSGDIAKTLTLKAGQMTSFIVNHN